jgi:hypothetical protein
MMFFSCGFYVFKEYYGVLTKYMVENVNIYLPGITYFSVIIGYKNITLGLLHAFYDNSYYMKLKFLLLAEVSLLMFSIFYLKRKICFYTKTKVWINQNTCLIRILLIFTFFFDYS